MAGTSSGLSTSLERELLLDCVDASNAVYGTAEEFEKWCQSGEVKEKVFEFIQFVSNDTIDSHMAIVRYRGNHLMVIFRGTASTKNVLEDLEADRVRLPHHMRDEVAESARVHHGFRSQYESLHMQLMKAVQDFIDDDGMTGNVFLTGVNTHIDTHTRAIVIFQCPGLSVCLFSAFSRCRCGYYCCAFSGVETWSRVITKTLSLYVWLSSCGQSSKRHRSITFH